MVGKDHLGKVGMRCAIPTELTTAADEQFAQCDGQPLDKRLEIYCGGLFTCICDYLIQFQNS